MCIHVSRVKMTYAEAADACEALNNSHLAFPRDALEMAVLKSMAPFDPAQNNPVKKLHRFADKQISPTNSLMVSGTPR